MKHTALITALTVLALTASGNSAAEETSVPPSSRAYMPIVPGSALPPGHPAKTADAEKLEKATVVSTIDVPGFTYIEVKQGHQTRWLAATTFSAKKDAVIEFESSSTLENFKSKALDRTFPSITFVNSVTVVKGK